MTAAAMRQAFAPRTPERRPRPGVALPHTADRCDTELRRLLAETRGSGRHPAFNVWLDERLRAAGR